MVSLDSGCSADVEPIEQIVLGSFEFGDGFQHGGSAPRHRVGVPLGLEVFVLGQRRLGDEGAEPCVVGGLGQRRQLLVDDRQLLAGA